MIPKWFDKTPQKSNADNISDLRKALANAASCLYVGSPRARTAFGHCCGALSIDCSRPASGWDSIRWSPITGRRFSTVPILDALCRALGVSF